MKKKRLVRKTLSTVVIRKNVREEVLVFPAAVKIKLLRVIKFRRVVSRC